MRTTETICGFQWAAGEPLHDVHLCVVEKGHEGFDNEDHFCYCGGTLERKAGEKSLEATQPPPVHLDDEMPF